MFDTPSLRKRHKIACDLRYSKLRSWLTYIPVLKTGRVVGKQRRRSVLSVRKSIAALIGLAILGTASAAWARYDCWRKRGFVIPCSRDGVNPVFHPDIFGNPAVAREIYGFVRLRDGTWYVEQNCVRGPYHSG
jgi:hypothetical protein